MLMAFSTTNIIGCPKSHLQLSIKGNTTNLQTPLAMHNAQILHPMRNLRQRHNLILLQHLPRPNLPPPVRRILLRRQHLRIDDHHGILDLVAPVRIRGNHANFLEGRQAVHDLPEARIRLVVQVVLVRLSSRTVDHGVVAFVDVEVRSAGAAGQADRPLGVGVLFAVFLVGYLVQSLSVEVIVVRIAAVAFATILGIFAIGLVLLGVARTQLEDVLCAGFECAGIPELMVDLLEE
mmetsp:Transcript_38100/g.68680  ORF Transcript_38100/g.68680 Transcript_38100/m.68680 type:complete len:235 (+) Transcript_38100:78-782(+)